MFSKSFPPPHLCILGLSRILSITSRGLQFILVALLTQSRPQGICDRLPWSLQELLIAFTAESGLSVVVVYLAGSCHLFMGVTDADAHGLQSEPHRLAPQP